MIPASRHCVNCSIYHHRKPVLYGMTVKIMIPNGAMYLISCWLNVLYFQHNYMTFMLKQRPGRVVNQEGKNFAYPKWFLKKALWEEIIVLHGFALPR